MTSSTLETILAHMHLLEFPYSPTRLLLVDGFEYSLRTCLLKRDGRRLRTITGSHFERAEAIRQHVLDSRETEKQCPR